MGVTTVVRTLIAIAVAAGAARAQETDPGSEPQDPPASAVELLREQIERQRVRLLDEQQRLEAMAEQLRAIQEAAPPPPDAGLQDQTPAQPPQDPEVSEFREDDPADVQSEVVEERDPLVGDFPRSFKIPGTRTSMRVGGFAHLNLVHSWDAIGSDSQFTVPSIPVEGTPEAGKGPRTTMSARQSRINLDVRKPTGDSYLRAYLETDFAGTSQNSLDLLRLRHAFGQFDMRDGGYVLAGKTWSTFMDVASLPDGIDFEGLVGAPFRRTALARWERPLSEAGTITVSLENPNAQVTGGESINNLPDLAVGYRQKFDDDHLYVAGIVRSLDAEQETNSGRNQSAPAYGVTVSGKFGLPWGQNRNALRFGATIGRGIGSLMTGTDSEGGQDGVFDPGTRRFESLPVFGCHLALEHWVSEVVRANLIYSYDEVDTMAFQPDDAYRAGHYGAVNLLWSVTPDVVFGVEQLFGVRRNANGDSGDATQTQFALKFTF